MFIRRDKLTPADTYSVRIIKGQRVGGKVKHKTILTVGRGTGEASIQKVEKEARDIIKKLNDGELYINRLGNISPIKNKKNNKAAPPPKRSRPPAKSTRRCSTCSERPVVAAADAPNNVGLHEVSYCHGVNNGVFDVFGQVYDVEVAEAEKHKKLGNGYCPDIEEDITSYLSAQEGRTARRRDELRNFGYSKDNKFGEVQVVLSLMVTDDGLPVGYKLFPGNTKERASTRAIQRAA